MLKSSEFIRGTIFDIAGKKKDIEALEKEMADPSFWQDRSVAQKKSQELSALKETTEKWQQIKKEAEDLAELAEIDPEDKDLETKVLQLEKIIGKEEKIFFLSGQHDKKDAILTIVAGAGGTDAQDWTETLLRMYMRWAEARKFKAEAIAVTEGGEAGLKNATLVVRGPYAYGFLKNEHGVHRLVRVSPFSSQGLRHTSFAMVEVLPEIDTISEVDISAEDLRVDTYRASGPGGQYVNKTESAVRITHLPTGLTVTSQSGRSQGANKDQAMKLLATRLRAMLEREHKEKLEDLKGEPVPIEWGRQIRSYVLHPYKMVKDHRTGYETSGAEAVLDGDLDDFIEAEIQL